MWKSFKDCFIKDNPVFGLFLGMCSTLAISTSLNNAIGMGLSVTFVLILSNVIISAMRKIIPDEIRIPVYIVVIATLVSILQMLLHAYMPEVYTSLGAFLSLIVVNCIILGRAEAFASKNPIGPSAIDGLGMGLGYTFALLLISATRELLSTWGLAFYNPFNAEHILFKFTLPFDSFKITLFSSPVGAFLTFAVFAAIFTKIRNEAAKKEEGK
ncbi:MAG: electron transport complex subunit E [Erysipelotrichaceae bacterium]|nr:electron transport complex subunit E [Erysipelotrichaceae bacterium]